jgi:hypothetical protein
MELLVPSYLISVHSPDSSQLTTSNRQAGTGFFAVSIFLYICSPFWEYLSEVRRIS